MRAFQLVAVVVGSLAVSAAPTFEGTVTFDKDCVTGGKCSTKFANADAAGKCIDSVPMVAGKCEKVTMDVTYTLDTVTRCSSTDKSVKEDVALTDLVEKQLVALGHNFEVVVNKLTLNYKDAVTGTCDKATIVGTGMETKACGDVTQSPFEMKATMKEKTVSFEPTKPGTGVKLADLGVQANLGDSCKVSDKAATAVFNLKMTAPLESTVAVKDRSIVFPEQADCKPDGCTELTGPNSVKFCLDNAAAELSCTKAVYTRTYMNLGSGPCDPKVPGKLLLNMDTILADDKALDFEEKHTAVTTVKFAKKPKDAKCTGTALGLSKGCADAPTPSTLKEDPASSFTFTGEEQIDAVATNYVITSTCDIIDNKDGDEVTVKTDFAISHDSKPSGTYGRIPLVGLLTAAATVLGISSL